MKHNENLVFGDAKHQINKSRQIRLRRPSRSREEDNLQTVKDYVEKRNREISETLFPAPKKGQQNMRLTGPKPVLYVDRQVLTAVTTWYQEPPANYSWTYVYCEVKVRM
jgi:hypothetical protein